MASLASWRFIGLQRASGNVTGRSAAIVIFQPGAAEPRAVGAALAKEKIVATVRGGSSNPGLRLSPHFYNTMEDLDRTVAVLRRAMALGLSAPLIAGHATHP